MGCDAYHLSQLSPRERPLKAYPAIFGGECPQHRNEPWPVPSFKPVDFFHADLDYQPN